MGLYNVFHYGPPSTLRSVYARDRGQAVMVVTALLSFNQMQHTDLMIKTYVANSTECRRAVILSVFATHSVTHHVQQKYCDMCEMNTTITCLNDVV